MRNVKQLPRQGPGGRGLRCVCPVSEAQAVMVDPATNPTQHAFVRYISIEGVAYRQQCKVDASAVNCQTHPPSITEPVLISLVKQEVESRLRRLIQLGNEDSDERRLLRIENTQIKDLSTKLRTGMDFDRGLTVEDTKNLAFALRLNDIFARRQAPHVAADGSRWFLVANNISFVGSELRCMEALPGSRLPTTQEIGRAMQSGLAESPAARAVFPIVPGDPELIWTSNLPEPQKLQAIKDQVGNWNDWVWAANIDPQTNIEGRLLRPERHAGLICVAPPAH